MENPLITIGFNEDGEADFGIRGDFSNISFEKLVKIRAMIPVAIYIAEDMWRRVNSNELGRVDSNIK